MLDSPAAAFAGLPFRFSTVLCLADNGIPADCFASACLSSSASAPPAKRGEHELEAVIKMSDTGKSRGAGSGVNQSLKRFENKTVNCLKQKSHVLIATGLGSPRESPK